jgi:hypothetical protein
MDLFFAPQGLAAAAFLLLLAGFSDGLGTRAVPLLVNRITPLAFVLTLCASSLLFAAGAALWIGGAWLAAVYLFGIMDPPRHFFVTLSFAYAPFVFSALTLLPLVGPLIRGGLRLWSFLLGLFLLVLLGLTPWQALLCAAGGALLVLGVNWLFSEPAAFFVRRMWATLAGHPRPLRSHLPRVIPGYVPGPATSLLQDSGSTSHPTPGPGAGTPP